MCSGVLFFLGNELPYFSCDAYKLRYLRSLSLRVSPLFSLLLSLPFFSLSIFIYLGVRFAVRRSS